MILESFVRRFVDPDALDRTVDFYKRLLRGEESLRFVLSTPPEPACGAIAPRSCR
jgi:hypothetical protein